MTRNLCAFYLMLPLLIPTLAAAGGIPCYVQLVKETCYNGYQVTLQVQDGTTQENIGAPVIVDAHSYDKLQQFSCKPNQQVTVQATFTPTIWQNTANTIYHVKRFWTVPTTLPPMSDKWIITLCFAKDFVAVPLPPKGADSCICNYPVNDKTQKM